MCSPTLVDYRTATELEKRRIILLGQRNHAEQIADRGKSRRLWNQIQQVDQQIAERAHIHIAWLRACNRDDRAKVRACVERRPECVALWRGQIRCRQARIDKIKLDARVLRRLAFAEVAA
jgi:hypothetical protein